MQLLSTANFLLLSFILNSSTEVVSFQYVNIQGQRSTITRKATTVPLTQHSFPDSSGERNRKRKWSASFQGKKRNSAIILATLSASTKGFFALSATTPLHIMKLSIEKFLLGWKTYCLIPVVAAFVGWVTNYLAVQMIFYPIRWRGFPLKRTEGESLGLFGWQGIVPAKTAKMSEAMVNVTINELLSMEETIQKLGPDEVARILSPQIPEMVDNVLKDDKILSLSPKLRSLSRILVDDGNIVGQRVVRDWLGKRFLRELTVDIQENITSVFNVRNCVVNQMMADRSLLGKLFQKTGNKELKFLTDSGLWFGFLLGIIQMFVALFCQNPWSLSIGGLIVGLATNWLALKWIFEPVVPTKFGPFLLQGLFLRRQKEVAKDFAEFFTSRILNAREMWKSILTDPTTSPTFRDMFARNLLRVSKQATGGLVGTSAITGFGSESHYVGDAVSKVIFALPYHFSRTSFYSYVDEKLEIEKTLRNGLESMSSKQFEQVLHPIFQEDELTLILAGGFLGFLAGFGQQLLAM